MSKFQVGDRVEFSQWYDGHDQGTKGTIVNTEKYEDCPGEWLVGVEVEGHSSPVYLYDYRLNAVEEEAVPVVKEFRFFRRHDGSISMQPYDSFEAALQGWKGFAQDGNEVEIIEFVSHGKYKAVLKIEEAI